MNAYLRSGHPSVRCPYGDHKGLQHAPVPGVQPVNADVCRLIDMSIAQVNIWLETDSLGLGGVWLGIAPDRERMDKVAGILDLPDNVEAFSIFVLGYPAEERKQQDRFDENLIHFVD